MKALVTRCVVLLIAGAASLGAARPAEAGVHIDIRIGPSQPVIVRTVVVQPVVVRPVVVQTVPTVVTTTAYSVPTYPYGRPVVVQTVPVVVQPAQVVYTVVRRRVVVRPPWPRRHLSLPSRPARRPVSVARVSRRDDRYDRHDRGHDRRRR